jgi:gas vesicle protein
MNITKWLEDVAPIKRKTSTDWVLPALLGVGAGIAAGISIGVLYAPDTGEETRLKLREGAIRAKQKAGRLVDRARHQAVSAAERAHAELTSS